MAALYISLGIAAYLAVGVVVAAIMWCFDSSELSLTDQNTALRFAVMLWPLALLIYGVVALGDLARYLGDRCIEYKRRKS